MKLRIQDVRIDSVSYGRGPVGPIRMTHIPTGIAVERTEQEMPTARQRLYEELREAVESQERGRSRSIFNHGEQLNAYAVGRDGFTGEFIRIDVQTDANQGYSFELKPKLALEFAAAIAAEARK